MMEQGHQEKGECIRAGRLYLAVMACLARHETPSCSSTGNYLDFRCLRWAPTLEDGGWSVNAILGPCLTEWWVAMNTSMSHILASKCAPWPLAAATCFCLFVLSSLGADGGQVYRCKSGHGWQAAMAVIVKKISDKLS